MIERKKLLVELLNYAAISLLIVAICFGLAISIGYLYTEEPDWLPEFGFIDEAAELIGEYFLESRDDPAKTPGVIKEIKEFVADPDKIIFDNVKIKIFELERQKQYYKSGHTDAILRAGIRNDYNEPLIFKNDYLILKDSSGRIFTSLDFDSILFVSELTLQPGVQYNVVFYYEMPLTINEFDIFFQVDNYSKFLDNMPLTDAKDFSSDSDSIMKSMLGDREIPDIPISPKE